MKDDKVPVLGSHSTSTNDSEIISLDNESKDFNKFSNEQSIDIDIESLPLTAHSKDTQMSFLRKVYLGVILQTFFSISIVFLLNNNGVLNAWISLPHMKVLSLSISLFLIIVISIITYAIPEFIRDSILISFSFLLIFGIFLGFLVQWMGNSMYMYSVYIGFVLVLLILFTYTFFSQELEFNFFANFIISITLCTSYFFIIIGYVMKMYFYIIPAFFGATFFTLYSIFFSQFVTGRSSTLYKKNDYVFGALKFNLDFCEVLLKVVSIIFQKFSLSKKMEKQELTLSNNYNTIYKN